MSERADPSTTSATPTDSIWPEGGKNKFIESCKSCNLPQEERKLRSLLYDVCSLAISNKLEVDHVVSALKDISFCNPWATSTLADVLLTCDIDSRYGISDKKKKSALIHLVKAVSNVAVSDVLLKERLEYDILGDSKVINNSLAAGQKLIKLKTRLFYKQQKFNLLREESEGYAKLVTELNQDSKSFSVSYMLQVIRSLIGCFNLDPNRVLDIILESFERRTHMEESFIPLIQKFLDNSSTLTQLLAFKFSFYQEDQTPESLYLVTAILLTHGLIELNDLFSYLSPDDALIDNHHKHEVEEAQLMAKRAAIISTTEEKAREEVFSDVEKFSLFGNNQKVALCLALLRVGNWNAALSVMNLMPEDYCLMTNRYVCMQVCHLITIGIDILYRENSGLRPVIAARLKAVARGDVRYFESAKTIDEFVEKVYPIIMHVGPFIYADTLLINKLIRMLKVFLRKTRTSRIKSRESTPVEPGEELEDRVDENSRDAMVNCGGADDSIQLTEDLKSIMINILDEAILPGISMIESNCGLSEELWQLLRLLPYETRYRLYHGWKRQPTSALLLKKRAETLKEIKYIMKRLSKENLKQTGRKIGKLSHSNPSFLFDNILSQIQTYDNLIGPVVDSFKFLTTISFDVLVYCIIEILADTSKGRTKHDGASISPWILSLANFCGTVVKKYPVQLPGLFQFIANQLKDEKSLDLLILKEIVSKMAGIEATDQMTNEQLAALSGGELLRQEGGYFNQVRNTRKSSLRLKEALMENNLAMPLCMLMAQQRNCILFKEQEHSHLKLVGKLYDQCQETLVQFGAFLSNNLSIDDYSGNLPSLSKLLTDYNLNPDIAFFLIRPMVSHRIAVRYEELRKARVGQESVSRAYIDAFEEITAPMVNAVLPIMKGKLWEDLSPRFFVSFWTLSMYDLEVPKVSYDRETDKLKQQIQQIEENNNVPPAKKKKDIERTRLLLEKLLEEQLKQDQHVGRVRQRLEHEKEQWFLSQLQKMEMTTQFFQYCLFPRCIFTASDALFCAKFVHILHTLKTPNFSTLICYDRIFGDISYTMSSCTENEANHFGRFLCALLETVMKWHRDKALFQVECAKYPGFIKTLVDNVPSFVDYQDYRHVCHKWHYRLTKALILCLDSEDYIQIRNSLLVLTKIIAHFPVITNFAQAIERRVELLRDKEKDNRKDLYALATGYVGQLKTKKPFFVPEHQFHEKDVKTASQQLQSKEKVEMKKDKVEIKKEKVEVKKEKVDSKKEVKKEMENQLSTSQKPRDSRCKADVAKPLELVKVKNEPSSRGASPRKLSSSNEVDKDVKRRKTTHKAEGGGSKGKELFDAMFANATIKKEKETAANPSGESNGRSRSDIKKLRDAKDSPSQSPAYSSSSPAHQAVDRRSNDVSPKKRKRESSSSPSEDQRTAQVTKKSREDVPSGSVRTPARNGNVSSGRREEREFPHKDDYRDERRNRIAESESTSQKGKDRYHDDRYLQQEVKSRDRHVSHMEDTRDSRTARSSRPSVRQEEEDYPRKPSQRLSLTSSTASRRVRE